MARRFWVFSAAVTFLLFTTWAEANFSTSIMKPTPVGANGVISASFPADGQKSSYYFSVNVQKGELLTQISFDGREGANKQVELALLNSSARVEDSYWIHGSDAVEEATHGFLVDSAGKRVLRVTVQGPETGAFCVLLGGSSFSPEGEQECWPSTGDAAHEHMEQGIAATDLRSAKIEVVESKCEQRLRIGSDVLFDFDQAETRGDAAPTLNTAARYLKTVQHAVRVEGHTDSKGTDAYNQDLSEKRANSVRNYLAQQGVEEARLSSIGFGETRPVAPNTHTDGSDDPEGRQKNRRVEIVLDTCERTARAKD